MKSAVKCIAGPLNGSYDFDYKPENLNSTGFSFGSNEFHAWMMLDGAYLFGKGKPGYVQSGASPAYWQQRLSNGVSSQFVPGKHACNYELVQWEEKDGAVSATFRFIDWAEVLQHRLIRAKATARIIVKTLIIPGDRTKEGTLVKGVSALWFEILRRIIANPDSIHQIDCWKWEELLAGAYKQDGWDTVVLTPKRGDHGIDVVAERKGWGQLRFLLLDQMKAYKPGHLIGPDEIREMKGVLLDHPEASKGMITTTAGFTRGALEAAADLAPRLELRPREKLVEWLASVVAEDSA